MAGPAQAAGRQQGRAQAAEQAQPAGDVLGQDASQGVTGLLNGILNPVDDTGEPELLTSNSLQEAFDIVELRINDPALVTELEKQLRDIKPLLDANNNAYHVRSNTADMTALMDNQSDQREIISKVQNLLDNAGATGFHGDTRNAVEQIFHSALNASVEMQRAIIRDHYGEGVIAEHDFEHALDDLNLIAAHDLRTASVDIQARHGMVEGRDLVTAFKEIRSEIQDLQNGNASPDLDRLVALDKNIRSLNGIVQNALSNGNVSKISLRDLSDTERQALSEDEQRRYAAAEEQTMSLNQRSTAALEAVFELKKELTNVLHDRSLGASNAVSIHQAANGEMDYRVQVSETGDLLLRAVRGGSEVAFNLSPYQELQKEIAALEEQKGNDSRDVQQKLRAEKIGEFLDPSKSFESQIQKTQTALASAAADSSVSDVIISRDGRLRTGNGNQGNVFSSLREVSSQRVKTMTNIEAGSDAVIAGLNMSEGKLTNVSFTGRCNAEGLIIDSATLENFRSERGVNLQNLSARSLDIVRGEKQWYSRFKPTPGVIIEGYKEGADFSGTDFKDARLGRGGGQVRNMTAVTSDTLKRALAMEKSNPLMVAAGYVFGRGLRLGFGSISYLQIGIPPNSVHGQFSGCTFHPGATRQNEPSAILTHPNFNDHPQLKNVHTNAQSFDTIRSMFPDGIELIGEDRMTKKGGREIILHRPGEKEGILVAYFSEGSTGAMMYPVKLEDKEKNKWRMAEDSLAFNPAVNTDSAFNEDIETAVNKWKHGALDIISKKAQEESKLKNFAKMSASRATAPGA